MRQFRARTLCATGVRAVAVLAALAVCGPPAGADAAEPAADVDAAARAAVAKRDELQQRHDDLAAQRDRDKAEVARIGGVPVMGDAMLDARQLAAWYRSTGTVPRLVPGTSIDDITALYLQEGADERVRGD